MCHYFCIDCRWFGLRISVNLSRLDARLFVASLYFSTSLFPLPDFRVLSALHCQIKKTHRNRIKRNASTPPPARATASNQKRKALLILSDENIVCSRKSWAIFFYVLLSPWDHKSSTKHHARFLVVVNKIFASNPPFFFGASLLRCFSPSQWAEWLGVKGQPQRRWVLALSGPGWQQVLWGRSCEEEVRVSGSWKSFTEPWIFYWCRIVSLLLCLCELISKAAAATLWDCEGDEKLCTHVTNCNCSL